MADSLIGPQGKVPGLVEEEGHRRKRQVERKRGCEPCPARDGEELKRRWAKRQRDAEAGDLKTCAGCFDLCDVGSRVFVRRR